MIVHLMIIHVIHNKNVLIHPLSNKDPFHLQPEGNEKPDVVNKFINII